jgi:hypothetical protein
LFDILVDADVRLALGKRVFKLEFLVNLLLLVGLLLGICGFVCGDVLEIDIDAL